LVLALGGAFGPLWGWPFENDDHIDFIPVDLTALSRSARARHDRIRPGCRSGPGSGGERTGAVGGTDAQPDFLKSHVRY